MTYQSPGWLRAEVVANAFVSQMTSEAESLRQAKSQLESALSSGSPLKDDREALDKANEQYRKASIQVRKHTATPKAAKAKAAGSPAA